MWIDTHAHYDDEHFDTDRDEVLQAVHDGGVDVVINCACDLASCQTTTDLMQKYPFVYGAMGLHPENLEGVDEEAAAAVFDYADADKVVAIGEIGLDYHYAKDQAEKQQDWFIEQIELAKELELPVIVHSRDAAADTMSVIKEYDAKRVGGVIHSYSGDVPMAMEYVKMGFYLGVGGMSTFPNVKKLPNVIRQVPLTSFLLETDCPYMAPVPNRGKRNDSRNLIYVAKKIAEIKEITVEEVARVTSENARTLFGL